MVRFWIGCSGFSYTDWIGGFYPPNLDSKRFLEFYSRNFNSVEINTTFYNWPKREQLASWARRVPDYFIFSFKLPRDVTHEKRLIKASGDVSRFIDLLKPVSLAGKLGVILVQLPPSLKLDVARLENFISGIPWDKYKFAIEFRHKSWLVPDVFRVLEKYNIAYVAIDGPPLPPIIELTTDFTYIRFHGHGSKIWYFYDYSEEELLPWVDRIKSIEDRVEEIYIYFNNHFRANAPRNAKRFIELLGLKVEELVPLARKDSRSTTLLDYFK